MAHTGYTIFCKLKRENSKSLVSYLINTHSFLSWILYKLITTGLAMIAENKYLLPDMLKKRKQWFFFFFGDDLNTFQTLLVKKARRVKMPKCQYLSVSGYWTGQYTPKSNPKLKVLPPQHQNKANQGLKNSLEAPHINNTLVVQKT